MVTVVMDAFLFVFHRKLHLELKKDRGVFTDGYQTELSNGTLVDVDLSFLYSGKVKGENKLLNYSIEPSRAQDKEL